MDDSNLEAVSRRGRRRRIRALLALAIGLVGAGVPLVGAAASDYEACDGAVMDFPTDMYSPKYFWRYTVDVEPDDPKNLYVCAEETTWDVRGQNSAWVNVADHEPSKPGYYATAGACLVSLCHTQNNTGVEVGAPAVVTDPAGPRDEVLIKDGGSCVLSNGGGMCTSLGNYTLVHAWVANADKPRTRVETGCTYALSACVPVSGAGVAVGSQSQTGYDTVGVQSETVYVGRKVPYQCVEHNTAWSPATGCQ